MPRPSQLPVQAVLQTARSTTGTHSWGTDPQKPWMVFCDSAEEVNPVWRRLRQIVQLKKSIVKISPAIAFRLVARKREVSYSLAVFVASLPPSLGGGRLKSTKNTVLACPSLVHQTSSVSPRRLDLRIRELCARVLSADDKSFAPILSELRSALHEHAAKIREMAVRQIAPPRKTGLRRPEEEPCQSTLTPTSD
jgi:hypothetical protein